LFAKHNDIEVGHCNDAKTNSHVASTVMITHYSGYTTRTDKDRLESTSVLTKIYNRKPAQLNNYTKQKRMAS